MVDITSLEELTDRPHAEVFDDPAPRVVRLELTEGEEIPAHSHPGTEIVLHLLAGEVTLSLDGRAYDLSAGELAQFSGDREISPRATEAATALLVFADADDA